MSDPDITLIEHLSSRLTLGPTPDELVAACDLLLRLQQRLEDTEAERDKLLLHRDTYASMIAKYVERLEGVEARLAEAEAALRKISELRLDEDLSLDNAIGLARRDMQSIARAYFAAGEENER